MSGSSNCARARLMSSCMKSSSSIRASFFASGRRDSARRRSSIDKRDFLPPPDAIWHFTVILIQPGNALQRVRVEHTTSMMYSMRISSMTFTESLAGLRSSPNPYIRFRTAPRMGSEWRPEAMGKVRTFFREQSPVIRALARTSPIQSRVSVVRCEGVRRRNRWARCNGWCNRGGGDGCGRGGGLCWNDACRRCRFRSNGLCLLLLVLLGIVTVAVV